MIENNYFFFDKFNTVVIFGFNESFKDIKLTNNKLGLNTIFITSKDQSKNFEGLDLDYNIFNKYDEKLLSFLKKKVDFNKTLFICFGSRVIFKKKSLISFLI